MNADIFLIQFIGQRLGKSQQSMFAGRVHTLHRISLMCYHRADINDCPRFGFSQIGNGLLTKEIRGANIRCHDVIKERRDNLFDRAVLGKSCIVDQDIETAEAISCSLRQ